MNEDTGPMELPNGVRLRDWHDVDTMRSDIYDGVQHELSRAFPISYSGLRLELENPHYEGRDHFSLREQKKAIMENKQLTRKLKGDLKLYDEEGNLLDEKPNHTLMHVPWMTPRGTFIRNGSEYTIKNQARLLPGPYTRRKQNQELETHFNVKRGTGNSFRIKLEPDTGVFRLQVGGSNVKLYPLLSDLGVSDESLKQLWGEDVLEQNRAVYNPRVTNTIYEKMVKNRTAENDEEKKAAIRAAFDTAQIHKFPAAKNLPHMAEMRTRILEKIAAEIKVRTANPFVTPDEDEDEYEPIGIEGVLASTEKLLHINRGMLPSDSRDSYEFKTIYDTPALIRERIRLDAEKIRQNTMKRVAKTKSLKPVKPRAFDDYVDKLISGNPLSMPLEETNPLHLVEQHRRVTLMGPGGLPSEEVVTPEAQAVHHSQFGFLSPLEGPESSLAGIDTRAAVGSRIGSDGRLYQQMRNTRTNEFEWVSPQDLSGKTLLIPE